MSKQEALGNIEREVRTIINRIRRMSVENAHRVDPRLSVPAYAVLFYIWDNGPVRAQDIVDAIGSDKGTVSRQISQLEDLGLVSRTTHPTDGRAQQVGLTAKGQRTVDDLAAQRRADFVGRLSAWDDGDLEHLSELLVRYNASLGH